MKKILCLLLVLLFAFSAACAEEEWLYAEDSETKDAEDADWTESLLYEAIEIWRRFTTDPLDVDPAITDDSGKYFLVLDERFQTYDGMREQVSAYFGDELTDALLQNGTYQELDGLMYTDRVPEEKLSSVLETEYTIAESTPAMILYDMSFYYEDRTETATFVLEKIDGEWRFTSFPWRE
ncbi:MAG: hypothetical protein ACOYI8_10535 [Christensenellales bacterium]|jgi:hypothetical protein